MSLYETVSSVAQGGSLLRHLKQRAQHSNADGRERGGSPGLAASEDLDFMTLATEFAECSECCDQTSGCCHTVLETVHAIKNSGHRSVYSILSVAQTQVATLHPSTKTSLLKSIYDGLMAVSATQSRLRLRCQLIELAVQLRFLRGHEDLPPCAIEDGWSLELARRRACLDFVSVGCDARLLQFLSQHPTAGESMEAAFGVRGGHGERARRLVELLYPSLLSSTAAAGDERASEQPDDDPALLLRLLLSMYPVFCFTPEEVARHLPAALPSHGAGEEEDKPVFDVVLFDEASQLPTFEALGCLGRARQCIVVGDDQQLPPRDGCSGLLDDALLANMALVPLTWHYRSAFRSLIHVSNIMFYNGSLQCVPSANDFLVGAGATSTASVGLVRQEVSGAMESNYAWRSEIEKTINRRLRRLDPVLAMSGTHVGYSASPQGFVNSEQAWRVLEALVLYMDEIRADGRPLSVGIITLNRPQRQLIHLLVNAARCETSYVQPVSRKCMGTELFGVCVCVCVCVW